MKIENRYLDGSYLASNPTWDREHAFWKANLINIFLKENNISPNSICDIGCGSGDVLRFLRKIYKKSTFFGYDVSPQASKFWFSDNNSSKEDINFFIGDFHKINTLKYDVLLVLDVFEHVRDPFTFLENIRSSAYKFIFHIPLDLSAFSVARKNPLIHARRKVGHLNFYNKDLAIEILLDCGFKIIDSRYTGASINGPDRKLRTRLASIIRIFFYWINKDIGVRLFGGETLIVLAE